MEAALLYFNSIKVRKTLYEQINGNGKATSGATIRKKKFIKKILDILIKMTGNDALFGKLLFEVNKNSTSTIDNNNDFFEIYSNIEFYKKCFETCKIQGQLSNNASPLEKIKYTYSLCNAGFSKRELRNSFDMNITKIHFNKSSNAELNEGRLIIVRGPNRSVGKSKINYIERECLNLSKYSAHKTRVTKRKSKNNPHSQFESCRTLISSTWGGLYDKVLEKWTSDHPNLRNTPNKGFMCYNSFFTHTPKKFKKPRKLEDACGICLGQKDTEKQADAFNNQSQEYQMAHTDLKDQIDLKIQKYHFHKSREVFQKKLYKLQFENLREDEVMVIMDFKQNISLLGGPTQSSAAFFNSPQRSLLDILIIQKENGKEYHSHYAYISECTTHDNKFVNHCLKDSMERAQIKNKHAYIWTDQAAQHFRSQYMLGTLLEISGMKFVNSASLHYFECYHGKSLCDQFFSCVSKYMENINKVIKIRNTSNLITNLLAKFEENEHTILPVSTNHDINQLTDKKYNVFMVEYKRTQEVNNGKSYSVTEDNIFCKINSVKKVLPADHYKEVSLSFVCWQNFKFLDSNLLQVSCCDFKTVVNFKLIVERKKKTIKLGLPDLRDDEYVMKDNNERLDQTFHKTSQIIRFNHNNYNENMINFDDFECLRPDQIKKDFKMQDVYDNNAGFKEQYENLINNDNKHSFVEHNDGPTPMEYEMIN